MAMHASKTALSKCRRLCRGQGQARGRAAGEHKQLLVRHVDHTVDGQNPAPPKKPWSE